MVGAGGKDGTADDSRPDRFGSVDGLACQKQKQKRQQPGLGSEFLSQCEHRAVVTQEHSRAMTSCAADLWDPVRFELQHTSIVGVASRGQPALDPMVFEAGLLGGPATATTLHPSSQTLIEEDPVSEKDSDKDGDAAVKPASDPMVLEAGLQAVPPSTEHAPTQEDTTGATDNIDTESAPATLHATPSTATPAASQEGDGGLPSEDGAECTPNVVGSWHYCLPDA